MSRAMPIGPALFAASCLLLQPATAFVGPVPSGHQAVAPGSTHQHRRHTRSFQPRNALLLAPESGDADLPGVADARLAGWRVASPVADSPEAVAADATSDASGAPSPENDEPGCGDVVEYPLSDLVKSETDDGRERGVAVIVSINKQRNDAWKLPEDILDKAELQRGSETKAACCALRLVVQNVDGTAWGGRVFFRIASTVIRCLETAAAVHCAIEEGHVLCPDLDNEEESVWMTDELESCAFAKLGEMKVLKSEFNGALDKWKRWTIFDELSEGCGSRDAEWEYDML